MNKNEKNYHPACELSGDIFPIASLPKARPPRVASIHDVSCIGRCATTVCLPILAASGTEACPLPTALLSTHTGGFTDFTFFDLTDEMQKIMRHWQSLGTTFDAVYSGFLGSEHQIEQVISFVSTCKAKNPSLRFFADPVMGDDGKRYATYTEKMCQKTRDLVSHADVITPNLTEACILLDTPYREDFTQEEIAAMARQLHAMGAKCVVITGVHKENAVGAFYYDGNADVCGAYYTHRDPINYPGTGDAFASILLAKLLASSTLSDAVRCACDFVSAASSYTTSLGTPVREGLVFEPLLKFLL